jgi:hypothetical protein
MHNLPNQLPNVSNPLTVTDLPPNAQIQVESSAAFYVALLAKDLGRKC